MNIEIFWVVFVQAWNDEGLVDLAHSAYTTIEEANVASKNIKSVVRTSRVYGVRTPDNRMVIIGEVDDSIPIK